MSLAKTLDDLIELFGKNTVARGYADWAAMVSLLSKDGQTWRWHYDMAMMKSSKEIEQAIINGVERARKVNVSVPNPFFLLPEVIAYFQKREEDHLAEMRREGPRVRETRKPVLENAWFRHTEPGRFGI